MRRIKEKLKSQSGTSLLYALAVFVVAAMVSAVILNAAVTANRRVHSDYAEEQGYLALSSTARLVAKALDGNDAATLQTLADNVASVADKAPGDGLKTYTPDTPDPSALSACVVVSWWRVYHDAPPDPPEDLGPKNIYYLGTGPFGQQLAATVKALDEAASENPVTVASAISVNSTGEVQSIFSNVEAALSMRLSQKQPDADPSQGEKYPITGVIQLKDGSQKLRLSAYNSAARTCATPNSKETTHPVEKPKPGGAPGETISYDELWYTDYYSATALGWHVSLVMN